MFHTMSRVGWLFLLAGLLLPGTAFAQMAICPGIGSNPLVPYAFETLTVSNTGKAFTASVYAPTGVQPRVAQVSLEGDNIRFRVDGVAPTSAVGHLVQLPTGITTVPFLICGPLAISQFLAIRTNTDASVRVTYYK